jgi:hypothetical protein
LTDEYTALQKYISTYRDPKAVAQEEGTGDGEEKKKKPWYKVSTLASITHDSQSAHTDYSTSSEAARTPKPPKKTALSLRNGYKPILNRASATTRSRVGGSASGTTRSLPRRRTCSSSF